MIQRIKAWWQSLIDHPVFRLEWRRIRRQPWWPGKRAFPAIAAGIGCVPGCLAILIVLVTAGGVIATVAVEPSQTDQVLDALLIGLAGVVSLGCLLGLARTLVELAVVWIAPAVAAMSIVREREMGTFDLLRTTMLSESSIVLGKLFGSLAWMWPGLLALAVLTPIQLISIVGTSTMNPLALFFVGSAVEQTTDSVSLLTWLLATGIIGMLRPWVDLVLHTAIGLLMSTVFRSPGSAIAATYGAIIVTRGVLWGVFSALSGTLAVLIEVVANADPTTGFMAIAHIGGLARVLVKLGVTALLVWGSVWKLQRE